MEVAGRRLTSDTSGQNASCVRPWQLPQQPAPLGSVPLQDRWESMLGRLHPPVTTQGTNQLNCDKQAAQRRNQSSGNRLLRLSRPIRDFLEPTLQDPPDRSGRAPGFWWLVDGQAAAQMLPRLSPKVAIGLCPAAMAHGLAQKNLWTDQQSASVRGQSPPGCAWNPEEKRTHNLELLAHIEPFEIDRHQEDFCDRRHSPRLLPGLYRAVERLKMISRKSIKSRPQDCNGSSL